MGTDMSAYVEVRKDGVWTNANTSTTYSGCPRLNALDVNRSYVLYGVLSGVRRSQAALSEGFVPLVDRFEQSGVPDDLSPEMQHHYKEWTDSCGYHSFGYLTAAQIASFDWSTVDTSSADDLMQKMLTYGDPENVRIIFWYD